MRNSVPDRHTDCTMDHWCSRLMALSATLAAPGALLVVLRVIPWPLATPWIQIQSIFPAGLLTSAAALGAVVPAFCLRPRGRTALLAACLAALLAIQLLLVLDRVLPDPRSPATARAVLASTSQPGGKQSITVMALNVGSTGIEAGALLAEVRKRGIDILALPELDPPELKELDAAGLAALLPGRVVDANLRGTGSGIFSRLPLEPMERVPGSAFHQSRAVARLPGSFGVIQLTAVHVNSPHPGHTSRWRAELQQLARLSAALPDGAQSILLGDFNATGDHREFNELLSGGFADAAHETGKGLIPTWPVNSPAPAFAALDHVLVSPGLAVADFDVVVLPGTDHAAVVAHLVLA